MNREDIIRMAQEAGMERIVGVYKDGTRMVEVPNPDRLERFAALVAAAEREACERACEHQPHWVACAAAIRARRNT